MRFHSDTFNMTVWPSGLRRWLMAPFRKGVGSNPTAVKLLRASNAPTGTGSHGPERERGHTRKYKPQEAKKKQNSNNSLRQRFNAHCWVEKGAMPCGRPPAPSGARAGLWPNKQH